MDRINIKNLEVFGRHGVLSEERVLGQKFIISASLYFDLREAGKTDDLNHSIDYGEVCSHIKEFVEKNTFSLIETVAEELARMLLIEYELLKKVWLEVKKPWAPIAVHLETVSVEIERGWHMAYIALGSNMGDRKAYLDAAVDRMLDFDGFRNIVESSYIETEPYGYLEQGNFLNGCMALETLLTPYELLYYLQDLEDKAGRVRAERWGPRTLDLDIILYDDIIMSEEILRIPHEEMHLREFVLEPLCEIAPYVMHPAYHKTVAEILAGLKADTA